MTYWLHNNDTLRDTAECPGKGLYCKPQLVAVIPVEDREQVERLRTLYFETATVDSVDALQAALREFANPKPPKPEEPTGLGAVVEDDEGRRWVRLDSEVDPWSRCQPGSDFAVESLTYAEIDAVRVLSEGVTP